MEISKIFHHAKTYSSKNRLKRHQNPSRYYNYVKLASQVSTQAKNIISQKYSYRNRPIIIIT